MSRVRSLGTLFAFLVWGIIQVGIAYGFATPPPFWYEFSVVLAAIIFRVWGLESDRGFLSGDVPTDDELDGET